MLSTKITLPPDTQSPRRARRAVQEVATSGRAAAMVDIAALLVSEMVTNAVLHARSDIRLTVECDEEWITVEVHDQSPIGPMVQHFSADAGTGRGMQLVEQLADDWGTRSAANGKVVWFKLGTPRA